MTEPLTVSADRQEGPQQADFWLCKRCGCLWRDNHDATVSLASVKQTSCETCEMEPSHIACLPLFRAALSASRTAQSIDFTNHHNALACHYCNPKGLILASRTAQEPQHVCGATGFSIMHGDVCPACKPSLPSSPAEGEK